MTTNAGGRIDRAWVSLLVLALQVVGIGGLIFIVPVIALPAAVVLFILSHRYRRWEKVAGVAATVLGAVGMALVLDAGLGSDAASAAEPIFGSALIGAALVASVVLALRAARRRNLPDQPD